MEEGYCFVNRKKESSDIKPVVYGVFDGMGGYSKGEVSSYAVALNAKKTDKKIECSKYRRRTKKILQRFQSGNLRLYVQVQYTDRYNSGYDVYL